MIDQVSEDLMVWRRITAQNIGIGEETSSGVFIVHILYVGFGFCVAFAGKAGWTAFHGNSFRRWLGFIMSVGGSFRLETERVSWSER
jgi:hypothetical protein